MYKTDTEFPGAGCWGVGNCQAAPGSPRTESAVNRNWTQECADRNLDQDCRQKNEQDPLQKMGMDKESKTLVIPQL